jgi:hypothetical protein
MRAGPWDGLRASRGPCGCAGVPARKSWSLGLLADDRDAKIGDRGGVGPLAVARVSAASFLRPSSRLCCRPSISPSQPSVGLGDAVAKIADDLDQAGGVSRRGRRRGPGDRAVALARSAGAGVDLARDPAIGALLQADGLGRADALPEGGVVVAGGGVSWTISPAAATSDQVSSTTSVCTDLITIGRPS